MVLSVTKSRKIRRVYLSRKYDFFEYWGALFFISSNASISDNGRPVWTLMARPGLLAHL